MVSLNALAVKFAILLVSFIGNYKRRERHDMRRISRTFSRWLLLCVSVAFVITIGFAKCISAVPEQDWICNLRKYDNSQRERR